MKVSEAPRAGWYPDPEGGTRLRWWDGTDWSDRYRMRPPPELRVQVPGEVAENGSLDLSQVGNAVPLPPQTAAVVEQVRLAARAEAERAARDFEARARRITGEIPPLISQYTSKFTRWFRVLLLLSFIVLLAWFIYQFFVQKSIFDWIGDRIDNISEENGAGALVLDPGEHASP